MFQFKSSHEAQSLQHAPLRFVRAPDLLDTCIKLTRFQYPVGKDVTPVPQLESCRLLCVETCNWGLRPERDNGASFVLKRATEASALNVTTVLPLCWNVQLRPPSWTWPRSYPWSPQQRIELVSTLDTLLTEFLLGFPISFSLSFAPHPLTYFSSQSGT